MCFVVNQSAVTLLLLGECVLIDLIELHCDIFPLHTLFFKLEHNITEGNPEAAEIPQQKIYSDNRKIL